MKYIVTVNVDYLQHLFILANAHSFSERDSVEHELMENITRFLFGKEKNDQAFFNTSFLDRTDTLRQAVTFTLLPSTLQQVRKHRGKKYRF